MRRLQLLVLALGSAWAQAANAVDLMVTSITATPTTVPQGSPITATYAVTATGGSVGGFYLDFYVSGDATITSSDTNLGSQYVPGLSDGQSTTGSFTFTPSASYAGTYYLGVIADSVGGIAESNKSNNAAASNPVVITKPDLTVTSMTATPATVPQGSPITATYTVTATGGSVGGFYLDFYVSGDATITSSDTNLGTRYVPGLSDGQSTTGSFTFTPSASYAGTYYLGVIADSTGGIAESNESNNAVASNPVVITKPDLMVTNMTAAPATVPQGSPVTATYTVTARGRVGGFYLDFYVSGDATITSSDTNLGAQYVPGLSDGQSTTGSFTFTPSASYAGTYYLGVIADSIGGIAESNKSNNAAASMFVVVSKPDLLPISIGGAPSIIGPGDSFTVTDTVAAAYLPVPQMGFQVGYYLSADAEALASGIRIGSRSLAGGMAAGQSNTASTTLTVPMSIAPGAYYFGIIVDDTGQVTESNEANNALVQGVVLVGVFSCQQPLDPLDDGNECTADSCDPLTGTLHVPVDAGIACASTVVCNGICDGAGTCTGGTPIAAAAACVAARCDPLVGLSYDQLPEGSSCDDGDLCTFGDVCTSSGECIGSSLTCSSDACNMRSCNGGPACAVTPLTGNPCDDGNACTYADSCEVGQCIGTPVTCRSDVCATRSCNGTVSCTVMSVSPGANCDDGDPCTYADRCDDGGRCAGTPVSCVSAGPCQAVQCDGTASCSLSARPAGTSCVPSNNACGQVCDGVSPYCQPLE